MQPNRSQQPQQHNYGSYPHPQNNSALAAQAVAAALSHPYGHNYGATQFAQASHYAQAYAQYYNAAGPSNVTAEGYTISSTYVPGTQYANAYQQQTRHQNHSQLPQRDQPKPNAQRPQHHGGGQNQGGWYQPGNCRCTEQGCSFMGSKKAVEIHMMDRHLIYPPGWEKRKKKDDWDADPSLKGKPVFIQGTSIRLDTPEAIEAWLAERRKRFPTKENVEDKERKMREAVERGQIPFDDGSRRKRKRADDGPGDRSGSQRGGRGGHRGRGRGRGRGRAVDSGWESRKPAEQDTDPAGMPAPSAVHVSGPTPPTEKKIVNDEAASTGEEGGPDSDSDSDGAPEIITSKAPLGAPQPSEDNAMEVEEVLEEVATETTNSLRPTEAAKQPPEAVKKPRPRQPRRPLYNPFAQRPSLLRNLLLPEIRMTVSNLSQAIHFLVDNDFLDNVELKPGQANERMIEVLPDHAAAVTAPASSVTSSTEVPAVPSPSAS